MNVKILIVICSFVVVASAHAGCATFAYKTSCLSEGGVLCADGGCYVCCDADNTGATTVCSGTYTTDTSLTFSDEKGSGYYSRKKYTKSCKCLEL
ncbi:MAG: hypothetical protein IJX89_02525 [Alphaproteobacteria bacterium]|nr:hypothetical protein [Alphaproteobacteria bacterium]